MPKAKIQQLEFWFLILVHSKMKLTIIETDTQTVKLKLIAMLVE